MKTNGKTPNGNGHVHNPQASLTIGNLALLPSQWEAGGRVLSPEARLMLAILNDAIGIVLAPPRPTQRPADRLKVDEALEWIRSDSVKWPASFRNVCSALGLTPEYLRPRILALRQQVVNGTAARPRLHRGAQAGNGAGKIGG